jgi:serine protease Do
MAPRIMPAPVRDALACTARRLAARVALSAVVVAAGMVPGQAAEPARPAAYRQAFQAYRDRVVAVTYVLRPREKPTGGEGRRVEDAECGLIVDDRGLVILPADPFPEPEGDPRTTLAPVEFKVHVRGGRPLEAEAVGLDRELNLAYLRIKQPPRGLAPLRFETARLEVGDRLLVIGLMARRYDYAPLLYAAMVNAVVEKPRRMYSLDLPVQDLSIGGLVITEDGRPVGLVGEDVLEDAPAGPDRMPGNTLSLFGSLTQGRRVGYPMVFPWELFSAAVASPPAIAEQEKRSWMGIIMQPLGDELIRYWRLKTDGGIIVSSVVDGSPAQKAGLRTSDILVALQGQPILTRKEEDLSEFRRRIERLGVGSSVQLTYLREGVAHETALMLEEAPLTAFSAQEMENDDLGLTVRQITMDDLLGQNLDPATRGVVVSDLEQAGWAQLGGLQEGDIIQGVDGKPVEDMDGFRHQVDRLREEKPGATLFFVLRQTDTVFVRLKTPWGRR